MDQGTPERAVEDSITYIADGLTTLGEVVERLRTVADVYERKELDGWELVCSVDQGRLFFAQRGTGGGEF